MLTRACDLLRQAVADGIFPGAVAQVSHRGRLLLNAACGYADLYAAEPMGHATVFDLASLTKPLATTLAVLKLAEDGRIALNQSLVDVLPEYRGTSKKDITLAQLLNHTSGLPAHRPYYERLRKLTFRQRRAALHDLLKSEPLLVSPGLQTIYSDLGFMLLHQVVDKVTEMTIDRFVHRSFYEPLGLNDLFFNHVTHSFRPAPYAATEWCPWRGCLLKGQVHDDNAWVLGGVEGHAGLFGTAASVRQLLQYLMNDYLTGTSAMGLGPAMLRLLFVARKGAFRPMGFDRREPRGSSAGRYLSEASIGHLGFTGTSVWIDPEQALIVVLLTNRIHPCRNNERIREFRPRFHDAVAQAVSKAL